MDTILGFLAYLLLELPARVIAAFPHTSLPVVIFIFIAVAIVVVATMFAGRRRRRGRRR